MINDNKEARRRMFLRGNEITDVSAVPNNELVTISNKKITIDILGIIVNHVVTILGTSS
jgi:hypothetical protein